MGISFLTWSYNQGVYHIDSIDNELGINMGLHNKSSSSDFIPIYMGTYEDCNRVYEEIIRAKENG